MRISIPSSAALCLTLAACAELGIGGKPDEPSAADALTQDQRMQWWREARFGMFIHWGLYAIPAGEWGERTDHAEWIRDTAQIPLAQYEELQRQFDPVQFDADQWVRYAKAAGMQYIVVTSKHHDGFCLFHAKGTDWDIAETPFKRDVLKELAEACKREGIRFCTYHSIMDWHHPDYLPRRPWEERSAQGADYDRYVKYLHGQVREIVESYSPSVMWFDGEWENTWTHPRGVELFELCRELAPKMIVNNRVDVLRSGMGGFNTSSEAVGDFSTPEQEIPATGMPGVDWETCMTMNDHWGYNSHDQDWKTSQQLVRMLIDSASKGGNFLLNVGPTAQGTFPPEAIERLQAIGQWMDVYAKTIRGTTASPFEELPWGRCTVRVGKKRTKLFLFVFDWPADRLLVVPGLGNPVRRAYSFDRPEREFEVFERDGRVQVQLPNKAPDAVCSVVVLEVPGNPLVYRTPTIAASSDIFVHPLRVEVLAGSEGIVLHYTTDGRDPTRFSPIYEGPLTIADACTLKVRAFHDDNPVSEVASQSFKQVTPLPAASVSGLAPGLRRDEIELSVERLPSEWDALTPASSSVAATIVLEAGPRKEHVVLRYRGFIEVPADDVYAFALLADDGAVLSIDEQVVVDNDGLHGPTEKQGTIALAQGLHPIELAWFNHTGGAELALRWAPLGGTLREVPPSALFHAAW